MLISLFVNIFFCCRSYSSLSTGYKCQVIEWHICLVIFFLVQKGGGGGGSEKIKQIASDKKSDCFLFSCSSADRCWKTDSDPLTDLGNYEWLRYRLFPERSSYFGLGSNSVTPLTKGGCLQFRFCSQIRPKSKQISTASTFSLCQPPVPLLSIIDSRYHCKQLLALKSSFFNFSFHRKHRYIQIT